MSTVEAVVMAKLPVIVPPAKFNLPLISVAGKLVKAEPLSAGNVPDSLAIGKVPEVKSLALVEFVTFAVLAVTAVFNVCISTPSTVPVKVKLPA